jgi:hypothetical protein
MATMDPQAESVVSKLHLTPHQAVLYVTGGGSQVSTI